MSASFIVSLAHDGPELSPAEMSAIWMDATRDGAVEADYYSNGGAVAAFERKIAAVLGKERAVLFPTGTLANMAALRLLGRGFPGRVIVHRDSHLFNDAGDNVTLSAGLTMVPLAGEGAGFTAAQVSVELARTKSARVASRISAIAVETPSRRHHGAAFPAQDLADIVSLAKAEGIPLFLDGARLMIEAAYRNQSVSERTRDFDLVYLSLYKYLGAPFGCVLAGPADMLDDFYHDRRRFGGGLYQMWPAAVIADCCLDGHMERWAATIPHAAHVLDVLAEDPDLTVQPVANGTNVVFLSARHGRIDDTVLRDLGAKRGLRFPALEGGRLALKINETWLRWDADDLAGSIKSCLKPAIQAP